MNSFVIEFNNKETKYKQLYQFIIDNITNGNLSYKEKLPSKRTLANDLKISQNTVNNVYELLKAEGYIYSKERSGYYINLIEHLETKPSVVKTKEILPKRSLYNLTTSQIDSSLFPRKTWSRLTKEALDDDLYYLGKNQGEYELRLEISKYLYEFRGINTNPENIVLGSGIEYLLPQLITILPERFGIENPGYKKISTILDNNNRKYSLIDLDYNNLDNVDVLYLTPTHQFPTGKMMMASKRIEIVKWAKNNKYIIEDDYDSEYRFDGALVKPLFNMSSNIIYFSTFSRTISPSIRIAFVVLPTNLLSIYQEKFKMYANSIPRIDQKVLTSFLSSGGYQKLLRKSNTLYCKKRDLIVSILKQNNISFDYYSIGLSLLIHLGKKINEDLFKQNLLKKQIEINFISQYYYHEIDESTIVLGFASIKLEDIPYVINEIINEIFSNIKET